METISEDDKNSISAKSNTVLLIILLANFIRSLGGSIIEIGLPDFILSLSGSLLSYGLVIGIFSITQSLFQFPMAAASDRFGRKLIILIGMSIYISGTFLCFLTQTITQLILFRAIQGSGAYSSILQAIISDTFKKEEQGKGMAYNSVSFTLGYFGGVSIGGYLAVYFGFRNIFFISAFLATVSAIFILFLFKDPKKNGSAVKENNNSNKSFEIKILLGNSQYIVAVIINSIKWFLFGGIIAYIIWVLQVEFLLNEIDTSYILIFIVGLYISFVLITGKMVDKFGSKKIILTGQLIIVGFGSLFYMVSISHSLVLFLIAIACSGLGFALYETSGSTLVLQKIEEINPELKGTGFGISNTVGFFFSALGPIVLSFIGETFSLFVPYYFIVLLILVSFLITFFFVKK